ncbi:MAG: DegT/DnrJ/EryC1/StrS family aminotransferase [Deltaproteobacteria bacterium]|nr:DegT/DnrJ/EryC1/StrS family aminotransferase [Deltaproteobacteria bacterium]
MRDEIDAAVLECLAGGHYILGERLATFEKAFADYLRVPYAVGVANGTDAIRLALEALEVPRGSDVLTAPNSAIPTAMAIADTGCCPIFADIDPQSWNLDPAKLDTALTTKTAAIVPVHLYGRPASMEAIADFASRKGIAVIEDCAQAHGAAIDGKMVGGFGQAAAFSFYPSKNLGAMGDAGMVVTANEKTAERLRRLRHYGQTDRYRADECGINSRLDDLQAAILSVKLRHLPSWTDKRREIAARYDDAFAALPLALPVEGSATCCVYHLYVVRTPDRDALAEHLGSRDISTQVHYPVPLHRQPAFAELGYRSGSFPEAETHAAEVLSLPLFPEMAESEVERVIDGVRSFFQGKS